MEATISADKLGLILRVGFFAFLVFINLVLFGLILPPSIGYLAGSAGATFIAAAVANTLSLRIFERRNLPSIGLNWNDGSLRNSMIGLALGIAAAALVLGGPLLAGLSHIRSTPDRPGSPAAALYVTVVLLFGAFGEELLFRGYGFQTLAAGVGRALTLIISSLLFGWAHTGNLNVSNIGIANTIGFGFVLGYAFLRSGDLWLPIGLHFGWNWILPLAGVNLSGFTMGVTGYAIEWRVADLWSGGAYGPEASVLTSAVIVLLLIALRIVPVRVQQPLLHHRAPEQEVLS